MFRPSLISCLCVFILGCFLLTTVDAADKKKLLLLGHVPDNHPKGTHEYLPGLRALKTILDRIPELDVEVIDASNRFYNGFAVYGFWGSDPFIMEKVTHKQIGWNGFDAAGNITESVSCCGWVSSVDY